MDLTHLVTQFINFFALIIGPKLSKINSDIYWEPCFVVWALSYQYPTFPSTFLAKFIQINFFISQYLIKFSFKVKSNSVCPDDPRLVIKTGIELNKVSGIDKLLLKFEYNAVTDEGRIASDYGVPANILKYYENPENRNTIKNNFDEYENGIFNKINDVIER